eukprot:3576269-Prymnesium_polylepis.1
MVAHVSERSTKVTQCCLPAWVVLAGERVRRLVDEEVPSGGVQFRKQRAVEAEEWMRHEGQLVRGAAGPILEQSTAQQLPCFDRFGRVLISSYRDRMPRQRGRKGVPLLNQGGQQL